MLFRRARFFGAILVVGLGVPFSAFAEGLSCTAPPADPLIKLLSPPPCDSCAETKAELEELQTLQRSRSDAEAKHALADYDISLSRFLDGAEIKFDARHSASANLSSTSWLPGQKKRPSTASRRSAERDLSTCPIAG
jgi:hypothetical protein